MTFHPDARAVSSLRPYVFAAAAFHLALLALTLRGPSRRDVPSETAPPLGRVLSIETEPLAPEPTSTAPGGGSPSAVAPKAIAPPPARLREAPARVVRAIVSAPVEAAAAPEAPPQDDLQTTEAAAQAALDRRENSLAMAAAMAAGSGGGAGGPGGAGAGRPAPRIQGSNAFGNGSEGALTGRVCFLPVGTLRIAEVRDCVYVATFYTDTLNIPERQFFDGFPGVTHRSEWFLIDYTGHFTVNEEGSFDFRLLSDDGSYLYIDDVLVIDNDGKHAPESRSGSVALARGGHRIKVRYSQTDDRMALQLFVRPPGIHASEEIFTPRF